MATILSLILLFSRNESESRLARALSEERPASLNMKINVPDATVIIDRQPYDIKGSLLRIDSLDVGEHYIYISRENYLPYETAVIFGKGEAKYIDVRLKLLPVEIPSGVDSSFMSLNSVPPMARVETSYGKFVGYTPIDSLIFPSGKYTLIFSMEDHVTKRRDVALSKNRLTRTELSLEKLRGIVSLQKVYPPEAVLYQDGRRIGKISRENKYSVEVGEKNLTLRADGYEDLVKIVQVKADETIEFTDSLKATYGSVLIKSNPSGADIFLDEQTETAGQTPILLNQLLASTHKVRAIYRNEKRIQNVKIAANDTAEAMIVFSAPNGFLELITDPPGAEIYVNTVRDGDQQTPVLKEVKPGFYKVRLSHPKFKKFYEITVRVRAEQTAKINYKIRVGGNMKKKKTKNRQSTYPL